MPETNAITTLQSDPAADRARAKLRSAADEVVGQIFYGTLLRQMRASSLKGEYGHGGRGEEVFQAQLDEVFAANAARGRGGGISDAIVDRFAGRAAAMERTRQEYGSIADTAIHAVGQTPRLNEEGK